MTLIMPDRTSKKSTFTFTQRHSKGGGGDKIGGIPKKLERERYFEGYKNFSKGAKNRDGQKKDPQKVLRCQSKISMGEKFKIHLGRQTP